VVEAHVAVWLLGEKDPEAAAWWHERAPHVLQATHKFVFPEEVCQEVLAAREGPSPGRGRRPGGDRIKGEE
jgi:hypothetical protein